MEDSKAKRNRRADPAISLLGLLLTYEDVVGHSNLLIMLTPTILDESDVDGLGGDGTKSSRN